MKNDLTFSREQIESWRSVRLPNLVRAGSEWRGPCPVHKGTRSSFALNAETGTAYCHSECARGWSLVQLESQLTASTQSEAIKFIQGVSGRSGGGVKAVKNRRVVSVYPYTDENGAVLYEAVRYEPKEFAFRRPDGGGHGGHVYNLKGVRRVLYGLPKVQAADLVFVVEGEKDAETLLGWGLVATTAPMGAGKWKDEYSHVLSGKDVVVVPDNDREGREHSEAVRRSVATCARSIFVVELPDLPEKGDVSDWKSAGGTREEFLRLVELARVKAAETVAKAAQEEATASPFEFRQTERGIESQFSRGDKAQWEWICPPLEIVAQTSSPEHADWGLWVRFQANGGRWTELPIPKSSLIGSGTESIQNLISNGFFASRSARHVERLKDYLYWSRPSQHMQLTSRIGWHGEGFLHPKQWFGGGDEARLHFYSDQPVGKYAVKGTVDDWKQRVGRYCSGNSLLVMSVAAAFAGPLLKLVGGEGGGLHLYGVSSLGKTTALHVAGSVWGGGQMSGFLESWKATATGMELRAALHNDGLLLLDEISEVSPKEISEIVYALSNGRGKSRGTKTLSARQTIEFRLVFLSTGEKQQIDLMTEAGKTMKGGQEARLVQVDADARKNFGIFDTIHGFESSYALQQHLSAAVRSVYGAPIMCFLERLVKDRLVAAARARAIRQEFLEHNVKDEHAGEVKRVASMLGLFAAAGEIATEWGITGFQKGEPAWAARKVLLAWFKSRGGSGAYEVEEGERRVRSFINQHESRFRTENGEAPPYCAGWRLADGRWLFEREVMRKSVLEGLVLDAVLEGLRARRILIANEADRNTYAWKLPKTNRRERFYCVVLEEDGLEDYGNLGNQPV